jgi:hypothetical protein
MSPYAELSVLKHIALSGVRLFLPVISGIAQQVSQPRFTFYRPVVAFSSVEWSVECRSDERFAIGTRLKHCPIL